MPSAFGCSLLAACLCAASITAQATIHMESNQVVVRPIAVYVHGAELGEGTGRITVRLQGKRGFAVQVGADRIVRFDNQSYLKGSGQVTGATLLLCDFSESKFPVYATRLRVLPALYLDGEPAVTGQSEVAVGRPIAAIVWTLGSLGLVLGLIVLLAKRVTGSWRGSLRLLAGPDGRMSLAKTQVALFTVAIGAIVFGYGLLASDAPTIPATLLYLMGLSLATGGASSYLERPAALAAGLDRSPRLSDLIMVRVSGREQISVSRAQMLFWTLVTVTLFCACTLIDDKVWEVPTEMVVLMGMSGVGYIGAKVEPPKKIEFPATTYVFEAGKPIEPLEPQCLGGVIERFEIVPPAPQGLAIDPATGVISGTPLTESPATTYTVTGSSKTGSVSAAVVLEVRE